MYIYTWSIVFTYYIQLSTSHGRDNFIKFEFKIDNVSSFDNSFNSKFSSSYTFRKCKAKLDPLERFITSESKIIVSFYNFHDNLFVKT